MPDDVSPQAVLDGIAELQRWRAEMTELARTNADFAFKWAERYGGVPKTREAIDKLLADYRQRFQQQAIPEADSQAMRVLEQRYNAWAKQRGIETVTQETLEQFDDETGLVTARIDEMSGFTRPKELARLIGQRCDELSRAAVALGCDDATVAALKGVAALAPDVVEGRADLDWPQTWGEARLQANQVFRSESIGGIPLHRAWDVALEKLEQAARAREQLRGQTPARAEKQQKQHDPSVAETFKALVLELIQENREKDRLLKSAGEEPPTAKLDAAGANSGDGGDGGDAKVAPAEQPDPDTGLPPSRTKARAAYDWAMQNIRRAEKMTIPELLEAIMTHPQGPTDCIPDNADTFGRYLRETGVKRYDKTGRRRAGRSIRRADEL
jgi:hypothetical protein